MNCFINKLTVFLSLFLCSFSFANKEKDITFDESLSAKEKLSILWNKIESTEHNKNEDFKKISLAETADLLTPSYSGKVFSHSGDIMISGRKKLIHRQGVVAKVRLVPTSNSEDYTGLFAEGADYGLIRLSFAKPPEGEVISPGAGIKFFIDGQDSKNLLIMYSLEGHKINGEKRDPGFFTKPFSHKLNLPTASIPNKLLETSFKRGLESTGDKISSALELTVDHFASVNQEGENISSVWSPAQIVFVPTEIAKTLFASNDPANFRELFPLVDAKGLKLYDVYATDEPGVNSFEENKKIFTKIASLELSSNFVSSKFGDESLFFKHFSPYSKKQTALSKFIADAPMSPFSYALAFAGAGAFIYKKICKKNKVD